MGRMKTFFHPRTGAAARGTSIYDVHTEGVGLRWTHVDKGEEVQPHVDVHTEN